MSTASSSYQRNFSLEDDWVAVKEAPFTDNDSVAVPAVAVDWNSSLGVFNVTLLSIINDGIEERLWSDSFSISKIRRRHFELCLVFPGLKNHLPALPLESQGFWGYIQWVRVSPKLCKKMEEYIKEAFNTCGWKLFSSVFFGEPAYLEEDYTIPTLGLKRNKHVRLVDQHVVNFQQHLTEKSQVEGDEKLFAWYQKLDDLLVKVNDAERTLLEFDCEPYEELRDIAQKQRTECASMFNGQSMTASTFQDSAQNFSQWEEQYLDSVKRISEFRIAYFKTSLPRLQDILKVMKEDLPKLSENGGKRDSVISRFEVLEKEFITNEIEILNCVHQTKILERDKFRQETITLEEDLSMEETLKEKEIQFYRKQCEIFSICFQIQDKNERIVRLDLKKSEGIKDDDIKKEVNEGLNHNLASIARRKALLRNKKKSCEEEVKKLTKKSEEKQEQLLTHHAVQLKIERRREEENEKKDVRLEERQKTLLRLKEYKKKYAKPKEVKPPRYQPPSMRKKEQRVKNDSKLATSSASSLLSNAKTNDSHKPAERSSEMISTHQAIPRHESLASNSITRESPKTPSVIPNDARPICVVPQGPPPPPPPPLPPPTPPVVSNSKTSLPVGIRAQKKRLDATSDSSPLSQPSSLSQETVNLDAILLARGRLKKKTASPETAGDNKKGFPSGNDLTRAIQSVRLRKVVNVEKPTDLSPDGAEFLKNALERMNRFTKLSDDEQTDDDDPEQDW